MQERTTTINSCRGSFLSVSARQKRHCYRTACMHTRGGKYPEGYRRRWPVFNTRQQREFSPSNVVDKIVSASSCNSISAIAAYSHALSSLNIQRRLGCRSNTSTVTPASTCSETTRKNTFIMPIPHPLPLLPPPACAATAPT